MNRPCDEIQESLSAYLDEELRGSRLSMLQEHLTGCEHCQEVLEDYRKAGHLLRQQVSEQPSRIDLGLLKEQIRQRIVSAPHGEISQSVLFSWLKRHAWPVGWALAMGLVIFIFWLDPQVWRVEQPADLTGLGGEIQEQLGAAIRDAAGIRFTARQVDGRHQERLGHLFRDYGRLHYDAPEFREPTRGLVQVRLGEAIRDHARSRWVLQQQNGQLQEKIGKLIQTRAHQQIGQAKNSRSDRKNGYDTGFA